MSIFRNAQQKIAHTSTVPSLGNKEFRNLQDVISTEKDFIKTNSKSAADWKKSSDALKTWGEAEGEDLNDILSKLSLLFSHYETSQTRFNNHLSTIRLHFKSLRTREESLSDLKSRKRSLGSKIEAVEKKLAKMGPENKELMKTTSTLKEYRSEMEGMIIEVRNEEAAIGDFKRRTTKDAMGLKCGGLLEMAEKMTIVAEIGKLMVEEIPLDITEPGMPRKQYDGFSKTEQLLSEATRCIADVGFAPTASGGVGHSFGGGHHRNDTSLNGTGEEADEFNRGNEGYPHSDPNRHQYEDGIGNMNRPELGENGFQSTPIYANNQSTFRTGQWAESQQSQGNLYDRETGASGLGDSEPVASGTGISTEGFKDTAADEWGRSAGAAIAGAASVGATGTDEPERETQAAQDAYRRQTDENLEDEYSRNAPNDKDETRFNSSSGYQLEDGPKASTSNNSHTYGTTPKSRENSNEPAPMLPPISTSTPLPTGSTGAVTPVSPSATGDPQQDDATYFASIGSTRAAQAAVRRPNSPPSNSTRYSGVPTVAVSQAPLASASIQKVYEPNPEGRKMTAAAFRKGFNRVPSAQNVGNPSANNSFGSAIANSNNDVVGDESQDSSSIQPLAIKKRSSYQPVNENPDGIDDAAPPYVPGGSSASQGYMPGGPSHGSQGPAHPESNVNAEEPRASIYGGMNDEYNRQPNHDVNSRRQSYQSAQTSQPTTTNHQYPYHDPYSNPSSQPPPVQPWTQANGSRPNSRPGSAQGSRPIPPTASQSNYYPSYPNAGY